jgi:hypothetical protein
LHYSVRWAGGPLLHYHLYGRAIHALQQPYGQTLYFPHKDESPETYQGLTPLTAKDVSDIKAEMEKLFLEKRYRDEEWGL